MARDWTVRCGVLVAFCLGALYLLYPTYVFYTRATEAQQSSSKAFCESLPAWAYCKKLNLGLDLQGGVHLVMGVRVDKAMAQRLDREAEAIQGYLQEEGWQEAKLDIAHESQAPLRLTLADSLPKDAVIKGLRKAFPALDVRREDDAHLALQLRPEEREAIADGALEQSIKTIRNRADKLGVTEPIISRRGYDQIAIQLPGVKDPEHAIAVIGKTAQLEFYMVDPLASSAFAEVTAAQLPAGVIRQGTLGEGRGAAREVYFEAPEGSEPALQELLGKLLPSDKQVTFGPAYAPSGHEKPGVVRTYVLQRRPAITGDYLVHAQVAQDREGAGDYYVTMTFDPQGAKIFEKLTADNVGRAMAIVLDGKVTSAPVINEKIGGGTARITLGRSGSPQRKLQEAKDLALVLKAGALPAPVEIREKRQVGKTLGQETVTKGALAMGIGSLLVVLFMALYYRMSGWLANAALALNVLFLLAVLAAIEATITLPGMAGIVLTVGMAVDANVLIFERIREELRLGKAARTAVELGYRKAWATIFDSNITTLIAAVVLMQFGSGPVKGFAVTLIIGLVCSMYTAIVGTRLIYDFILARRSAQSSELSI